jgi:hypothetical protein
MLFGEKQNKSSSDRQSTLSTLYSSHWWIVGWDEQSHQCMSEEIKQYLRLYRISCTAEVRAAVALGSRIQEVLNDLDHLKRRAWHEY